MTRASTVLLLLAVTACAGGRATTGGVETARVHARLAARARAHLGHAGAFQVGAARFAADCSGFVAAVYEAEGIPLRRLMAEAAPAERSGVAALWKAAERHGRLLPRDAWPAPGDLVFWHDTWDRDGDGRRGDRLTHVGIVQWVDGDTVRFVHRGSKAVAAGSMTVVRRGERQDADGKVLNTPLRRKTAGRREGPVLAGELVAGYGRIAAGGR